MSWSTEEESLLVERARKGIDTASIAWSHHRTIASVRLKIAELESEGVLEKGTLEQLPTSVRSARNRSGA